MDKIEKKRQNDKDIVAFMIRWYCKKKQTFCSNCKSHCYSPEMRGKIKDVMRFSGPRLLLSHPILAIRHAIDTIKNKRRGK